MYIKGIDSDGHNYIRVYGCVCGHCNVTETLSLYPERKELTVRKKPTIGVDSVREQREITCRVCGKTVTGYFNANRKYCSNECQHIAHYKRCYERKGLVYQACEK